MRKDVKKVVENCLECLKNNKSPIQNHPALALAIKNIFDIISIDLSFGFEVTENGFIGILVIMEYLSKYPYIIPIKSKSAEEIAHHLFIYISMFGAPKKLLSDQGKEFINEIIKNLTLRVGAEHRITSPYNPSTDGMVEKHMDTFANALRKCIKENKQEWIQWIPFLAMAYRSRIHSTTNKTPFEIVFGRKMNMFEAWKNEEGEDEELALFKRTVEIKKLMNYQQQLTQKQIEKAQEKQKEGQDNRNKVSVIPLEIGTTVFIRDMRTAKPKLEPRFKGPYTIYGRTPLSNYWLMDNNNKLVEQSYPRSKLKVAKNFESEKRIRFKMDENQEEDEEMEQEKLDTQPRQI